MKNLFAASIICFLIFGVGSTAMADKKLYVSGKIGANSQSDTNLGAADVNPDPGLSLSAALGVELENPFRVEGEMSLFHNSYDARNRFTNVSFDGNYDLFNVMANVYYDFMRDNRLNPYVGVGGGFSVVNVDFNVAGGTVDDTTAVGAFQGIAGVEYEITPRFRILGEYRYFLTSDPDLNFAGVPASTEYDAHHFLIGARLYFK